MEESCRKSLSKKVQFYFTDETCDAINRFAEVTGARSMSAVIRDALKTYAWLIDEQRAENKILSKKPNTGEAKESAPLTITPLAVSSTGT